MFSIFAVVLRNFVLIKRAKSSAYTLFPYNAMIVETFPYLFVCCVAPLILRGVRDTVYLTQLSVPRRHSQSVRRCSRKPQFTLEATVYAFIPVLPVDCFIS